MLTDGRTTDGRTDDGVTGILIAHLGAFGSGELKNIYIVCHETRTHDLNLDSYALYPNG